MEGRLVWPGYIKRLDSQYPHSHIKSLSDSRRHFETRQDYRKSLRELA